MGHTTWETSYLGLNKAKEYTTGQMAHAIRDSGVTMKCTAKALFNGLMEDFSMERSKEVSCMEKEFTLGLMGAGMKAITTKTKNTGWDPTPTQTGACIKDSG